jgi:Family of unknown function (DUF5675)
MFKVTIARKRSFSASIGGDLYVNGVHICKTLELAWIWNEKNRSCVPLGTYRGFVRRDKSDGWRIQLLGVPGGRDGVQIHVGNYPKQIQGCVLVGENYTPDAIWSSHAAYKKLEGAYLKHRGETVTVEFTGLLATPWGDFDTKRLSSVA